MWILFILLCLLVGWFANKKFNRNFFIWSLIAFFFSPLLSVILLFILDFIYTNPEKFSRQMLDLYKLYENNIISQEEFENKKINLINSIKTNQKEEFLVKILPLVENKILTNEDIEKIKRRLNV